MVKFKQDFLQNSSINFSRIYEILFEKFGESFFKYSIIIGIGVKQEVLQQFDRLNFKILSEIVK